MNSCVILSLLGMLTLFLDKASAGIAATCPKITCETKLNNKMCYQLAQKDGNVQNITTWGCDAGEVCDILDW